MCEAAPSTILTEPGIRGERTATYVSSTTPVKGYQYDMSGHVEQCVEQYCALAKVSKSILKPVATPCIDDRMLLPSDFETKGKLGDTGSG